MFDTNKMTIRFWLRTNCVHPESTNAPLYCHIRINGVHTNDFSVDLSIPIQSWNAKSQEVNLDHPLAEQLNTAILNEKRKLLRLKEEMEEKQQYVSAAILKKKYIDYKKQRMTTAKEANSKQLNEPSFFKIMEEVIKKKTKKKAKNTFKNNKTWKNNWKAFLIKEGILKITAREMTAQMGEKFIEFLQERIKSNSHISNHITLARKVMNKAIIDGYAQWNPFLAITHSYESNFDPEGLEAEQVVKLLTCRHYTERQQHVVDAFLFMAGSSMDHCDYLHMDWSLTFEDDRYWITYPRQKNAHRPNQPDAIPFVLDFGVLLWKKYGKNVSKLPRMSLPEMNRVIKVAARIAGVEFRKLTSKRARKTYANVCSNDIGLTDEALMYLMGHTTTKHLRAYRKIKRKRVLSELNKLKDQ